MSIAENYAKKVIEIRATQYKKVIKILYTMGRKNKKKMLLLLEELRITPINFELYRTQFIQAKDIASGLFTSAATGIAASQAPVTAVGLFGAAITGTAISTLSVAAATNAILAWLGGGSLAAGGGGMAMGSLVLGSIALAPALLVGGFMFKKKAEQAYTYAFEYEAKVNKAVKEIGVVIDFLEQVNRRIFELKDIMVKLSNNLENVLTKLDTLTFNENDNTHMNLLKQAILLMKNISEVSSTPVVDDKGKITVASHEIVLKY